MAIKKQQIWFILPLVVFLVVIVLFYTRLGKDTTVVTSTMLNKSLPNFSLPMLQQPDKLLSVQDLPKTPYILNVWGSWCITCRIEHPFLLQMADQGIPIVGINYKDETANALNYLHEHKDPFVLNVQDSGSYGIELGLTGAPESFVVDSTGVVRQHIIGEINEQRFNQQVLPCITALRNNADETTLKGSCQ
ncbi:periplasmic protein thiol-disulfide oxidoreductase DsbE [Moraxella macacae 0408225]|uniref:Periplasmic protein thiol-disulfide oxidoreductase DsbE n=1 Tax=Moraxella macacae 0408225 TaxID=1230338 RepID=L2F804_9GAMM|nr:DsbE family thiol:disulfide interchange protein [Moraxella macacae]ELA08573.1 periplasmic protein thiol-disulfide oxidoreductase DsbE [Moraxella macacae 0408225]